MLMQPNNLTFQFYVMAFVCLSLWFSSSLVLAQQPATTRYVYDDNGRLRAVITTDGKANIYEYDAAGNLTAIRQNAAGQLEILDFFPREGGPGTVVKIVGTGFTGTTVSSVVFNGIAAQTVTVAAPQITVTVPAGATTGPIAVTTSGGTATTAQPFVVRGITVTPSLVVVLPQQIIDFTATAIATIDQQVVWSVDSVVGGSDSIGIITQTGRYTAPRLPDAQPSREFIIRATSADDDLIAGEARVIVRNPEFFRAYYSPVLSVVTDIPNLYSVPISVINGTESNLFSPFLSIINGSTAGSFGGNLVSQIVSVSTGPGVLEVLPAQLTRGVTRAITVNGVNLTGATELVFLNPNGSVATGLSASGLSVNVTGTTLTANATVGAGIATGKYVVMVRTPIGISALVDTSTNSIEVIQ